MDIKGVLIIAVAAIIIYSLVLSPEAKNKVKNTAAAAESLGKNIVSAVAQKGLGKPNCTSNEQCQVQFGNGTTCDSTTGNCMR